MFGGVAADETVLFALTCTEPRACAFCSCLGLLLKLEGEGSTCKPGKEKGAPAPLSLLLLGAWRLGGSGRGWAAL